MKKSNMRTPFAKNRVPLWALALATFVGGALSFVVIDLKATEATHATPAQVAAQGTTSNGNRLCNYTIARVNGFDKVRPLLYSEPQCESPRYDVMRNMVGSLVQQYQANGIIASAAVYVRDFRLGEWTCYNGEEEFDPASMLKLPVMLTWLSMSEEEPGLLDRTYTCEFGGVVAGKTQFFPSAEAQPNRSYTVRQLLELMTVNSDNRATQTLMMHMPTGRFCRVFTDLGLRAPDMADQHYAMNVRDVSIFLKALYNGSYLSPMNSEYALEMLTRCDFKQGVVAGVPAQVAVAHKFGESGDPNEKQLHETALIYVNGHNYLLTIMTRGQDIMKLPEVLSAISKLVYEQMSGPLADPFPGASRNIAEAHRV